MSTAVLRPRVAAGAPMGSLLAGGILLLGLAAAAGQLRGPAAQPRA